MWRANIRKLFIKGENKELNLKVFNGIPEAPADGEQYVRKNRFWRKLEGAIDIDNEVTEHSENAVKSSGIWTFVTGLWDSLSQWVTGTFVSQANEDKGSVAKQEHEQEYDHDAFLTSLPSIPSDVSDLTDDTNLIPPHLFFDDQYFSGEGTQVDPKSLRVENLPSGGGGDVKKICTRVVTKRANQEFTKWNDGTNFDISEGDKIRIIIDFLGLNEPNQNTRLGIGMKIGSSWFPEKFYRGGLENTGTIYFESGSSTDTFRYIVEMTIIHNDFNGVYFSEKDGDKNISVVNRIGSSGADISSITNITITYGGGLLIGTKIGIYKY